MTTAVAAIAAVQSIQAESSPQGGETKASALKISAGGTRTLQNSRGASTPNGWGKFFFSVGGAIIGMGFRVIVLGGILWAGVGMIRWTFVLAAREATAIGKGAKQIQEAGASITA